MMGVLPKLPNYHDDEVRCFHPVFEAAAKRALQVLKMSKDFRVVHHREIGVGAVDFAIERMATGRIVLLCEIKRTPSSVRSWRNRIQACGYRTEAGSLCETDYYLLSNLETTDVFKYSESLPKIAQQIISPSPVNCGLMSRVAKADFYKNLTAAICKIVTMCLEDSGVYQMGLSAFQNQLEDSIDDVAKWHQRFMPVGFEYLRGATKQLGEFKGMKNAEWSHASLYRANPENMMRQGNKVDFKALFSVPYPAANDEASFGELTLSESFNSGEGYADGEDLASLVNEVVRPRWPETVETDDELARYLATLAYIIVGGSLGKNQKICDPAAGAGMLLKAASSVFQTIGPSQLWANEINPRFKEVLSLRLGLGYAKVVTAGNAPLVTIEDISLIDKKLFDDVKIILMNPPFKSGIESVRERGVLAKRIRDVSGEESIMNVGQAGLETVFLELVCHLVKPGTIIASIMPSRHLEARGTEAIRFREFLLRAFGLVLMSVYPKQGLFQDVTKGTAIVIGVKGEKGKKVKILRVGKALDHLSFGKLVGLSRIDRGEVTSGVEIETRERSDLRGCCGDGWGKVVGSKAIARKWCIKKLGGMKPLRIHPDEFYRGRSQNSGCTTLALISPTTGEGKEYLRKLPEGWIRPGIKSSRNMPPFITNKIFPNPAPAPPKEAFVDGTPENDVLTELAALHIDLAAQKKQGSQRKKIKSIEEVINAIRPNLKLVPSGSLLIPRASREFGSICITMTQVVVASNMFVAVINDLRKAEVLACWLSSVFAQIQFEILAIDQEGERKVEKKQIREILCPPPEKIPNELHKALMKSFRRESAARLNSVAVRSIDRLWARYLFGNNGEEILTEAYGLLADLYVNRQA